MPAVEDSQKQFEICMQGNCLSCPSYPRKSGEGLFCVRGASAHAIEKRGCHCPDCPLWKEKGLTGMYYCIKLEKDDCSGS